jgi:hydroxyacylglutathione hydrolase
MLLKRLYDPKLAQASYLVGCAATGEALVIDPNRDIDQYLEAAEAEGVRITHVTETHIHADFISGSRELAQRTGARLFLSDEGDAGWKYQFASEAGATLLHDGDSFKVGNIEVKVFHTPGHTPEHLSFMITDTAATDRPMGVFTGDFIFAGDVGRPDLLERAAGFEGTMVDSARILFRSLKQFATLPDYFQLWPGHGAGSACGKSLGAIPSTTLGYEKLANWAFGVDDENAFVQLVLADQPEPPKYFAQMKRINKEGPVILHGLRRPERLAARRIRGLVDNGALIVDTRHAAEYALGHVPGTLNIPLGKTFPTWAGSLLPYDRDIHLLVESDALHAVDDVIHDLAMIGLDRIAGYLDSDALAAWVAGGDRLALTPQISVAHLAGMLHDDDTMVIDVRGQTEWNAGHIAGARNIPLGNLEERIAEVPRTTPMIVHCQSGARSAIAASVLEANGFGIIANVTGGFAAWAAAGYSVARGTSGDLPATAVAPTRQLA